MSQTQTNKETIRRFVEVVKNQRHLDKLGEFFTPDYVEHNAVVGSFGTGVEGYRRFLGHLFEAFPDDRVTIEIITGDGDLVSYRASESGTHRAEFLKLPATGKSAKWTEIHFMRMAHGKVVEHWIDVDIFGWFQQLGVIPRMG